MIHGPLGFHSLHPIPFSDWALLGYGHSPLYLAHVFLPCVHGLVSAPAIPLHFSCYDITYPFALLLLLGLRAEASTMSISYIIPSFGLYCHTLGFLGPFHSLGILGPFHPSLPLSLPWVFCKSFGLPWPNYHILTFRAYWPLSKPHEFTNTFL